MSVTKNVIDGAKDGGVVLDGFVWYWDRMGVITNRVIHFESRNPGFRAWPWFRTSLEGILVRE